MKTTTIRSWIRKNSVSSEFLRIQLRYFPVLRSFELLGAQLLAKVSRIVLTRRALNLRVRKLELELSCGRLFFGSDGQLQVQCSSLNLAGKWLVKPAG